MSSTQGPLVLVLMGATAAAPWAALALESRCVRAKLARHKARRTLRAAGFRAVSRETAPITGPGDRVALAVAPPGEVFVSVGAIVALPDEPPGLAA